MGSPWIVSLVILGGVSSTKVDRDGDDEYHDEQHQWKILELFVVYCSGDWP